MAKIEIAIMNTQWKIEEEEKRIEEMRQNIKQSIDSKNLGCEASFILSYAMKMDEAAKKGDRPLKTPPARSRRLQGSTHHRQKEEA